jgi:asparagine synthetase B (glutamine-hydrolysing)
MLTLDRGRAMEANAARDSGAVTLRPLDRGRRLEIRVPFTATEQVFYRVDSVSAEATSVTIASDPRRLRLPSTRINDAAVLSVLQFGAIVPPMSLWRGVHRLTPGCRAVVQVDDLRVEEQMLLDGWPAPEAADPTLEESHQVDRVVGLLDDLMHEACPRGDPVILFSGGVDSGLIAARAAAMGWRDTLLVHYSMRDDDPETVQAQTLARHLGLQLEVVRDRECDDMAVLDRVAAIWPQPFGDTSTLPTHALARAVIERLRAGGGASRVIFDGTGADGCFGMFSRVAGWHSIMRVPLRLRRLAAATYAGGRFWRHDGPVERRLRLLRRSCQMPMLPASVAQNPLLDIAYRANSESTHAVSQAIGYWLEHALPCADDPARLAGLDLCLVCANIFAQKNKPIFDASAHRIVFPFLDQRMVGLALRRAVRWPGTAEGKRVLKAALAGQVPAELVYRRKSGFVAPLREKLADRRFLAAFDRLLDPAAPLAGVVDLDRAWLARARRAVAAGRALPPQTHSFIWAAVFTNLWLMQAHASSSTA